MRHFQRFTLGLLPVVFTWIILANGSAAQSVITIKLGTLNPQDAKAGFIVGITTGRQVDEKVDFGLGADLFIRQFTQESTVSTGSSAGGSTTTTIQTNIDYSMFGLPIMVHLNVIVMPNAVVKPYVGLAGGYELVFSREANYLTGNKDSRLYGGFGWQLMLGGEYALGSSSGMLAEVFYNGCTVKRSKGSNEAGFPLHEELDFSGFGFRVGVRFAGM